MLSALLSTIFKRITRPDAATPFAATELARLLDDAVRSRDEGRLQDAERTILLAMTLAPESPTALLELARVMLQTGRKEDALASLERANSLPHETLPLLQLGIELSKDVAKWQQAADWKERIVTLSGDSLGDWIDLARLLRNALRLERALEVVEQALERWPDDAHLLLERGQTLCGLERFADAANDLERSAATLPNDLMALSGLVSYLSRTGQHERAIQLASDFLARHGESLSAYLCHTQALRAAKRNVEAIALYEAAAARFEDRPEPWINLSHMYTLLSDHDRALAAGTKAVALAPHSARAHVNHALNLLVTGNLKEGWRHYQWRYQTLIRKDYPVSVYPEDPSVRLPSDLFPIELKGRRICLIEDQGLGDELSFLRFAPLLRKRGAYLAYVPDPRLATMVDRSGAVDEVIEPGGTAPPDTEIYLAPGDQPLALEIFDPAYIPPPLRLPAERGARERIAARLAALVNSGRPLVGVTWRAGTQSTRDDRLSKSVSIEALAELLRDLPVDVIVLQRKPVPGEIEQLTKGLGRRAHDFSDLNDDLESMLALLHRIDDYVTVSNTNVHLRAGAGKPARILVPAPPDYRWMATGKTSPWFPGMTIYRQESGGSWDTAFAELVADLRNPYADNND